MKLVLMVEGQTETAFLPYLRNFIRERVRGPMPKIETNRFDGRIPTGAKLQRVVTMLLSGSHAADHVIALTDVYTGSRPPEFFDALDAREKMRRWVGQEPRFHPHAAQHDFEAWLLPYWPTIQRLAGHNRAAPAGVPESVNHNKPPAHRIKEIFEIGDSSRSYIKPRDANRILRENDLLFSVQRCPEFKHFVNTILRLSGGDEIL